MWRQIITKQSQSLHVSLCGVGDEPYIFNVNPTRQGPGGVDAGLCMCPIVTDS